MNPKKNNSGGKKFQSRMPDEKRVKVSSKRADKPEPKFKYDDKPYKKKPFDAEKNRDGRVPFEKKKFGESKPGEFKREGTERPYKKRSDGFGAENKDRKPYEKKTYGDRPTRGYKKTTDTGVDKPYGKKPYSKPGESTSPRAYGKKPFGDKRTPDSRGPVKEGGYKKPAGKFSGEKRVFREDRNTGKKYTTDRPDKPGNFKGRGKAYSKTSEDLLKGKKLVEDEVRLNRYIANSGLCSRREADVMIEQGLVTLNGETVLILGSKVNPGDDVRVDGKRINPEKPVYILLNKPKGFITSTSDPNERATVMDLIDLPGKERIYPVGRLDRNTTGVLLLTNDGELAQKLMHPSFEIKKIYRAKLNEKPSKDHLLAWVQGVELEDGYMNFEQVGFVDEDDDTVLGLEVHSGRNRIVRRMFEHFGYEVMGLDRVMLGEFDHLKLGRGKWRFLNEKEIRYVDQLKRMKGKKAKH